MAPTDVNEVVNGHCNFVQAAKILLAHNDKSAHEAIYLSNPFINLVYHIPVSRQLTDNDYMDSSKLNI